MTCVRIVVSSLQQQQPSRGQASLLSFPKPPPGYLLSPNDRSILERRLRQNRHVSYVASWGTREERKSKSAQPPTAGDGGDVSLSWIYNHFEIYLRSKKTFSCPPRGAPERCWRGPSSGNPDGLLIVWPTWFSAWISWAVKDSRWRSSNTTVNSFSYSKVYMGTWSKLEFLFLFLLVNLSLGAAQRGR